MVKEQYDQIAEQYKDAEKTIEGIYVVRPTFLKLCGVHACQRSVLDLACGSGIYSRVLKEAGAKRVVGIDISEEQIKIARRTEMDNPLGIEYFVGDAGTYDFVKLGSFGVATAVFLLEYASSREELQQICRNVYLALQEGGIFIAITDNPDAILPTDKKYEVVLSLDEGSSGEEGCKRRVTFYRDGVEVLHVYNYLWSRGTYEGALRNAGFQGIRWRNPVVSEEGMQIFGESFWVNFLENPNPIVIEAKRTFFGDSRNINVVLLCGVNDNVGHFPYMYSTTIIISKRFVFETGSYISFLGLFGVNIFKRKAPLRTGAARQFSSELVG